MKSFAVCGCAVLAAGTLLKAQLNVPQLGTAHYADGTVHKIHGIGANLIVDSRAIATADSASFADSVGLLSDNGLIRLLRADGTVLGEYHSHEPLPLLHIDSTPQSAVAWLPSSHLLLRWDGFEFFATAVEDSGFGGKVAFVSLGSNTTAQFFVTRPDSSVARVSVSLPSGLLTSSDTQPGVRGWIAVQQGWLVSQDERGLLVERPDGNRQIIPLSQQPLPADDLTVEPMSNHWLHISSRSTRTNWAVYLDKTKVSAFLLPPPASEAAR